MNALPPLPLLPSELREQASPEVQAYLLALEAQVAWLGAALERLTAQIKQNSQNSSKPPSSDGPDAPPRPKAPPSGRKRGAPPGHAGHHRALLPEDEVDGIVTHWPRCCPECQTPLPAVAAEGQALQRQQVWELPPLEPEVIEHRYPAVCCPHCQRLVRAQRPPEVPPGAFGSRLTSLMGLLTGRYRLSRREVVSLMDEAFEVEISLGSVVEATQQLSAALAVPYTEVVEVVAQSAHANVDETSWKEAGAKRWLWVAVTRLVTLFFAAASRAGRELDTLLGPTYGGYVTSDRHKAYLRLEMTRRQLCWAHLKPDLLAYSQYSGATGAWGKRALEVVAQRFALWHRFRAGELERATLQTKMQPLQAEFAALLAEGPTLSHHKARGFCADLLKYESALWTFLAVEGIEPTNNAADRALRPAVLWRKGSFGSQSDAGLRFVERILTVTATCRQQQRPLLPFLTAALHAHWASLPPPSLLPPA
jgi:transposase